mgnify:CR=1 FL=1
MKRDVQAVMLLLLGAAITRIAFSDIYLRYVKETLRPFLIATGGILLLLGAWALWDIVRDHRQSTAAASDPHLADEVDEGAELHDGHGHGQMRIAWLLLLPVLSILLIAPPALGAYSAERQNSTVLAPASDIAFDPLPAGNPVPLSLSDYAVRAVWDDQQSLAGRTVQMTGFVTPVKEGQTTTGLPAGQSATWTLTRLALTCCAADATVTKILAVGAKPLPANTWVTVTGTWIPGGPTQEAQATPWLQVRSIQTVPQPKNPYE